MSSHRRVGKAVDWRARRLVTATRQYSALAGTRRDHGPARTSIRNERAAAGREDERQSVVMCTWRRLERLERTCEQLAAQTVPVELHVWNNNWRRRDDVAAIARAAEIPVYVVNSRRNVGGFGRFYLARELASSAALVVFIDDDHEFSPPTVERLLAGARPLTLSGWWAWRFLDWRDYGRRERVSPLDSAHYVGTGGMIADSSIFRDPRLFSCPRRFWFAEDLWLSYVANHLLGWDLFRSGADFVSFNDEHDLFRTLGNAKTRFLRYLVDGCGWNPARGSAMPALA